MAHERALSLNPVIQTPHLSKLATASLGSVNHAQQCGDDLKRGVLCQRATPGLPPVTSLFAMAIFQHPQDRCPPEVWKMILRLAVDVDPAINAISFAPNEQARAIRTKKSIRLVSTAWNSLSTDLFFRQVHIWNVRNLTQLVDMLEASKNSSRRGPPHGWWVRDIQLYLDIGMEEPPLLALLRLLDCCERIDTFSYCTSNKSPVRMSSSIISSLANVASSSLKQVEFWSWDNDVPEENSLYHLLDTCKSLTTLSLGDVAFEQLTSRKLKSSSVTRLHISPCIQELVQPDNFPSLQHLTILPSNHLHEPITFHPFFDQYGQNLVSLDCRVIFLDISYALDMCPNLTDLVYSLPIPPLSPLEPHRSLRRIGIRHLMSVRSSNSFTELDILNRISESSSHLNAIMSSLFPALQSVAIPDGQRDWIEQSLTIDPHGFLHGSVQHMRYRMALHWALWEERLKSRGVTLVDRSNHLIRFPPFVAPIWHGFIDSLLDIEEEEEEY